eukprot:13888689-Ditylum_brightwellii.AAC.1
MCRGRYNCIIKELHIELFKGQTNYSDMVDTVYDLLNGYQDRSKIHATSNLKNGTLSFGTVGEEKDKDDRKDIMPPTNGGKVRPDITCHK